MSIDALKALGSIDPRRVYGGTPTQPIPGGPSFSETLKSAVGEVEALQTNRDELVQNMIKGEVTEVHDVMVAAEEAQLAFELMLEIRNRLLESYQEIMRTQV